MSAMREKTVSFPLTPTGAFHLLDTATRIQRHALDLFHQDSDCTQALLADLAREIATLTEQTLAMAHCAGCVERVSLSLRLSE